MNLLFKKEFRPRGKPIHLIGIDLQEVQQILLLIKDLQKKLKKKNIKKINLRKKLFFLLSNIAKNAKAISHLILMKLKNKNYQKLFFIINVVIAKQLKMM